MTSLNFQTQIAQTFSSGESYIIIIISASQLTLQQCTVYKQFYIIDIYMKFNFQELKKKYCKKSKHQQQKQKEQGQRLVLFEDLQVNPLVLQECAKIEKDYITYYNNNRYFYVHDEPDHIDTIKKIKEDEFTKIRKQLQVSLIAEPPAKEKNKTLQGHIIKKRVSKAQKEIAFRYKSYLFRKNIKIIVRKLKILKLTMKDIIQKQLFSDVPYKRGKQIFQAVKSGDDTKVWRLFIENRFVIYSVDSTGKTPLMWACIRGYSNIAEMIIGMGTLIDKVDIHKFTALHYAIQYKYPQCVKILLLNEAMIGPQQLQLSLQQKRFKVMMQLSISIMNIIKRLPIEKRTQIFEEQLKHLL